MRSVSRICAFYLWHTSRIDKYARIDYAWNGTYLNMIGWIYMYEPITWRTVSRFAVWMRSLSRLLRSLLISNNCYCIFWQLCVCVSKYNIVLQCSKCPFRADFRRDACCPLPPHYRSNRRARVWRYVSGASPYQKYDGIALSSNYY